MIKMIGDNYCEKLLKIVQYVFLKRNFKHNGDILCLQT